MDQNNFPELLSLWFAYYHNNGPTMIEKCINYFAVFFPYRPLCLASLTTHPFVQIRIVWFWRLLAFPKHPQSIMKDTQVLRTIVLFFPLSLSACPHWTRSGLQFPPEDRIRKTRSKGPELNITSWTICARYFHSSVSERQVASERAPNGPTRDKQLKICSIRIVSRYGIPSPLDPPTTL